jgi:general secretion pathway protein N
MNGRTGHVVLLLICLGLVTVAYGELGRRAAGPSSSSPSSSSNAAGARDTVPALPPAAVFRMAPRREFRETLARPLFAATRRPPPKETEPEPEKVEPAPVKARLLGVIITPEGRTALVSLPTASDIVQLTIGQRLEGWSLEQILPDRIILRRGALTQEVEIERDIAPAPRRTRPGTQAKPRRRRSKTSR